MPTFGLFNNEPDVRSFSAGQTIFEAGAPGDAMYAVLEGEVEIRREERVFDTIAVGNIFGEMALIDQQPRSAAAVAKTDCRVAVINEARLFRLISQNPRFALQMMKLLTERIRNNMNC